MSQVLLGRMAIKAQQIKPGEALGVEVKEGQLLQIIAVEGKQISDFVAFNAADPDERLSTAVTRSKNNSIMLQKGMSLYSNRRNAMFDLVEDTVGRHDMLVAACDAQRSAEDEKNSDENSATQDGPSCLEALTRALSPYGIEADQIPDPVNWFMNVSILQRGELEQRESLAERNDHVVLRALMDTVVGITACPQVPAEENGAQPSEILVRIFR
ncbi:MAG TPA: urea carboxylase-associated family protein [Thermomicrobiales bacterium]